MNFASWKKKKKQVRFTCSCRIWQLASHDVLVTFSKGYLAGVVCDSCEKKFSPDLSKHLHFFHCTCGNDICLSCMEKLQMVSTRLGKIQLGPTIRISSEKVFSEIKTPSMSAFMLFQHSGRNNFEVSKMC